MFVLPKINIDHVVLVTKVADNSLAKVAGLLEGDIILEIDNVELHRVEDLVSRFRREM